VVLPTLSQEAGLQRPSDVIFSQGCSISESLFQSPSSGSRFSFEYIAPSWLSEVHNLKLRQLLPITIRHEGGYYFINNTELDITEGGPSLEQAMREFADFFLEDYLNWRKAKDSELTGKAAAIRRKYLDLVEDPSA